jgi:hypothetical protein
MKSTAKTFRRYAYRIGLLLVYISGGLGTP